MAGKARVILPKPPDMRGDNCWEPLRRDLQHPNIHYTVLGLTPQGRPMIKLVGPPAALRHWLDVNGHWNVEVES